MKVGQYVRQRGPRLPWRIGVIARVHDGDPPIAMRFGVRIIVGADAYKHDLSWYREDELEVFDVAAIDSAEDLQAILADSLRRSQAAEGGSSSGS